jgi:flagellar assembly factor FliW
MIAVALKCPIFGSEAVRPMALQTVKSGMPVIIWHVLIKHGTRNTGITAVNPR